MLWVRVPLALLKIPFLGVNHFSVNHSRGDRLMAGRLNIRPQPLACYRAEGGWLSWISIRRFESCKPRLNAGPGGVGFRHAVTTGEISWSAARGPNPSNWLQPSLAPVVANRPPRFCLASCKRCGASNTLGAPHSIVSILYFAQEGGPNGAQDLQHFQP